MKIHAAAIRLLALFAAILASAGAAAQSAPTTTISPPAAEPRKDPRLYSPEDGWLDVSGFLDQAYGFLPVIIPITEPAVGYGAAAAVAFIDKPKAEAGAGFGRPNISVVGGLRTENGTRGGFGGDMRYWMDDRLQTLFGGLKSTVHLDYYGSGEQGFLNKGSASYKLEISGALAQAKYRLGQSQNWIGMGYAVANTKATAELPTTLPGAGQAVRIGGITAAVSHDSRDNIFTPLSGNYLELSGVVFDKALGSDLEFSRMTVIGMQYFKLDPKWTLGLRESVAANHGDAPFYMQPFVLMRGVPAMRYLGEKAAQAEAEVRWQFWQRFSVVGFAGAGSAVSEYRQMTRKNTVTAGGVGMRYEIARKYGLHMGLDMAWSRDGPAVYVQFGSAWMRP